MAESVAKGDELPLDLSVNAKSSSSSRTSGLILSSSAIGLLKERALGSPVALPHQLYSSLTSAFFTSFYSADRVTGIKRVNGKWSNTLPSTFQLWTKKRRHQATGWVQCFELTSVHWQCWLDDNGWCLVGAIYFIPNVFSETNGERQREVGKQSRLITHVLCVKGSGHTYWWNDTFWCNEAILFRCSLWRSYSEGIKPGTASDHPSP